MLKKSYTQNELNRLLVNTKERRGWDFSLMKTENQPAPWDYLDVVSLYLKPNDHVLDVGTGGGERFLKLAKLFKSGIGIDIDPEMIKVAKENAKGIDNVTFYEDTEKLEKTEGKFNAILCRHACFDLDIIFSRLRSGGYFITQEVGERNMLNIKEVLNQEYGKPALTKEEFLKSGFKLIAFMEYNIEYVVKDIESLVFWLNALDYLHSDLEGEKALADVKTLNEILNGNIDKRGFITNEQRYLAIAQKK